MLTSLETTQVLICQTQSECELWYKKLKAYCVQFDFHKDYRTARLLGKGSFSKVYGGCKKRNMKRVAIKTMRKEHFENDKFVSVILAENVE